MGKWNGTNSRSSEAKKRIQEKKINNQLLKEKELEDLKWEDKITESILEKKKKNILNDQKKFEKKIENRQLLIEEEIKLFGSSKKGNSVPKKTKKEIEAQLIETSSKIKSINLESKRTNELTNPNIKLKNEDIEALNESNHIISATGLENILVATSVLSLDDKKHLSQPKMNYKTYESKQLPEFKEKFPTLKLSQIKNKIWKEWGKSPENPINAVVNK